MSQQVFRFKRISDDVFRALHPVSSNSFGIRIHYHHTVVVKLPEMFAFEKVSFAINVLKGSINVRRNASPHGDVSWII